VKSLSQTNTRFSEDVDWSKRFTLPSAVMAIATKSAKKSLVASKKRSSDCLESHDEEPDYISAVKWQLYRESNCAALHRYYLLSSFIVSKLSPLALTAVLLQNNPSTISIISIVLILSTRCLIFTIKNKAASQQTLSRNKKRDIHSSIYYCSSLRIFNDFEILHQTIIALKIFSYLCAINMHYIFIINLYFWEVLWQV